MHTPQGLSRRRLVVTATGTLALSIVPGPAIAGAAGRAPGLVGRTLYVTNSATDSGDANITRFTVNTDGMLTPIDQIGAGRGARGMAITPDRRFAYVSAPVVR